MPQDYSKKAAAVNGHMALSMAFPLSSAQRVKEKNAHLPVFPGKGLDCMLAAAPLGAE